MMTAPLRLRLVSLPIRKCQTSQKKGCRHSGDSLTADRIRERCFTALRGDRIRPVPPARKRTSYNLRPEAQPPERGVLRAESP